MIARPMRPSLDRAVLGLLLATTILGAATFDRRAWPHLVGDEATYLMQAESLARDGDLAYSRADYERFVAHWGRTPEGLILQSADGGETLVYGKPPTYSLFLAPFVALSPSRGPAIANALLLALAAVAAARALERRIGRAAPLWVAVFVFGSVAFAYVLWAHADLFMMCLVAIALALAYGAQSISGRRPSREDGAQLSEHEVRVREHRPQRDAGGLLRWLAVGALLGLVLTSRPPYATLLLPVALAVPPERRRAGLAALAAGAGAVVLVAALANVAAGGAWTSYGGERQSFYGYTGFPGVDLPASAWRERVAERGEDSDSWVKPQTLAMGFEPRQAAWNLAYLVTGRHVGLLPYFLPLLLGVYAFRRGEGRAALLLAIAATLAFFLWVRPFNFYGGGGAIANRYFLPLYPAFWFLAARPAGRLPVVAAALAAAPFLLPLWAAPRAFPIDPDGGYHHVSAVAERLLPYETTLSHLKPSGREDFVHHGLWIKLLSPRLAPADGAERIVLAPGGRADLLVGSPRPLADLWMVESAPQPAVRRLALGRPRAAHRMWWTDDPFYLYEIGLDAEGAPPPGLVFALIPEPPAGGGGR